MTDEEEIAGALVQPSKLARHNGNISEGPCGNSCGRLTLKERLTGAVHWALQALCEIPQVCRGTGASIWAALLLMLQSPGTFL